MNTDAAITVHLLVVVEVLRAETPDDLPIVPRTRRLDLLDRLEGYALARQYPEHRGPAPIGRRTKLPPRYFDDRRPERPRFVDDTGTHCAVGYLMAVDDPALALAVDAQDPFGWVLEMEIPALGVWAAEHGFTLDELAWIQPSYNIPIRSCEDLTDVPPAAPRVRCVGVHLEIITLSDAPEVYGDGCVHGCWDYDMPLWVVNAGSEPSPVGQLSAVDSDLSPLTIDPLPVDEAKLLFLPNTWSNHPLRVTVPGDCEPDVLDTRWSGTDEFWPVLDRDGDGAAAVQCGGWDCRDDRYQLDDSPDCDGTGSGQDPATCDATCAVYDCMRDAVAEAVMLPDERILACVRTDEDDPSVCLDAPCTRCGCGTTTAARAWWIIALGGLLRRSPVRRP